MLLLLLSSSSSSCLLKIFKSSQNYGVRFLLFLLNASCLGFTIFIISFSYFNNQAISFLLYFFMYVFSFLPRARAERMNWECLTEDLQIEILSRLLVKSLMRFKCVQCSWNILFKTLSFENKRRLHNYENGKVHIS